MTAGRPVPLGAGPVAAGSTAGARVVGVLPDVPALGRVLDYLVPEGWLVLDGGDVGATQGPEGVPVGVPVVRRGSLVRVPLQGRRVRGWVVDVVVAAEPGRRLRPVASLVGCGPSPELVELAGWAARRWLGRPITFLRAASPDRVVRHLPARRALPGRPEAEGGGDGDRGAGGDRAGGAARAAEAAGAGGVAPSVGAGEAGGAARGGGAAGAAQAARGSGARRAGGVRPSERLVAPEPPPLVPQGVTVVRLPPAADPLPWLRAALERGQALVLTPGQDDAARLAGRLRRAGHRMARHPGGWAAAATGASVVGSRAAAWMPAPDLAAVVVLDEHDPRFRDERRPAWHAREVAVERARRAGVPCLLVSPTPSLEALLAGRLLVPPRSEERAGWPTVQVIDRTRDDDPVQRGLYSPALVRALRSGRDSGQRVGVVLNRTGRARLLACGACGRLATCERCGRALASPGPGRLTCQRCSEERPAVCSECGSTALRLLRAGVSRVREELEALLREPVGEVTATAGPADSGAAAGASGGADGQRVLVGTEALLHRATGLDAVAFLDLDADLCAPRFRAGEQVLGQLARAARLVGGRDGGGHLLLQTRQPGHEVVEAAVHADPGRWARVEAARRRQLELPPFAALARLEGPGAQALAAGCRRAGLAVLGPLQGRYLVRAPDPEGLTGVLAQVMEGSDLVPGAVRIDVDPPDA